MVLLQSGHSIIKKSANLALVQKDLLSSLGETIEDSIGAIEEMVQVLQGREGSQMNAVRLKIRGSKAGHHLEIGWSVLGEGLREQDQNLSDPVAIPNRGCSVHRGRNHEEAVRSTNAGLMELNDDLLENRLHSTGNGGIPIGAGQEVGQASDDADTGLSTNTCQGL